MIYDKLIEAKANNEKLFSLLIDPDKLQLDDLIYIINKADTEGVDFLMIGGSLLKTGLDEIVKVAKENSELPVMIFPGNASHVSTHATGIFLLSLVSGRNPEYLIGNHVAAAPILHRSKLEIISTAYILIDGGKVTSVEYISDTKPIPADKPDIAVATALAGQQLGLKTIYLEAGSGAEFPVSPETIKSVKSVLNIPLMVGGGLKKEKDIEAACKAGADIIVVGTAIEQNPKNISKFSRIIHSL